MATTIHVEAARIPDRDRLLVELQGHGLDAVAVDELAIEVPCGGGDEQRVSDDVFAKVENLIMRIGSSFVPIKHEQVIYIRPPVGYPSGDRARSQPRERRDEPVEIGLVVVVVRRDAEAADAVRVADRDEDALVEQPLEQPPVVGRIGRGAEHVIPDGASGWETSSKPSRSTSARRVAARARARWRSASPIPSSFTSPSEAASAAAPG